MPKPVARALVLAVAAFLLLLLSDVLLFDVFRGGIATEHRDEVLLTHITFHAAVLVFTGFGAWLGFLLLRNSLPSWGWTLLMGAAFGLISILGVAGMLQLTGIYGVIGWLFFGGALSALGSQLLSRRWPGRALSPPSPPESR